MTKELQRYDEPLEVTELAFLTRKEKKERKLYYKVYRMLMVMSFIIPFIGAWYRAFDGAPNAFSAIKFFVGAGVLLMISSVGTYMTYKFNLRMVQWDVKQGTKTVEVSHITKKQFVPHNNTYYFYLDSPNKMSIEVSSDYYHALKEGDEINIEYSTNAKFYFGYF